MLRFGLLLLIAAGLACAGLIDNFNRSDDPAGLGPNWINLGGSSAEIADGHAQAFGEQRSQVLVQYTGLTEDSIYADVTSGDGMGYVALVLGVSDAPFGAISNYFIKVQQNVAGSGGFDSYAFYYGNNGSSSSNSGPFSNLTTTFTSGRILARLDGRTATLIITPDGGGAVQTYSYTYSQGTLGNGVGLGFYGAAAADNFGAGSASEVPEPASLLLFAGVGVFAMLRVRRQNS